MKDYHRIGSQLDPHKRSMYFRLGAEIEGRMTVRFGFKVRPSYAHEKALTVLEAVNWKSLKAARAMWAIIR